jgi:hypothetical protein
MPRYRYTLSVQIHSGAAWERIYDGASRRTFLGHFVDYAQRSGASLLAVCPQDTDPLLELDYPATITLKTYQPKESHE